MNPIVKWVLQTMMKGQTGVMRTLPDKKLLDFNVNMTIERLLQNNIDPSIIKTPDQLDNIIKQIEAPKNVQTGIKNTKSAKVMDMEGKEIDPRSKIMGGKQAETEAEILARINKENKETAQKIRDRKADEKQFNKDVEEAGGMEEFLNKNPIDDDTGDFAQGGRAGFSGAGHVAHTEGVTNAMLKHYKKYLNTRKGKQKKIIPLRTFAEGFFKENLAQGGRAGFRTGLGKGFLEFISKQLKPRSKPKFDVEKFRKGPIDLNFLENIDKKDLAPFIRSRDTMGPGGYGMYDNFADMPAGLKAAELIKTIRGPDNKINYKAAELFLGKKLKGNESANELIQMLNRQEMRAEGGRIGLKDGMDRRTFLKIMSGLASVPILGKFLKPAKVASKAVKAVPVVSKSTPPAYFFELAEKIKTLGRVTDGPQERIKIHSMPAKDGKSELMLTEDIGTGEMQIKKIGKEEDMTTKVETMEYTPGSSQADETTQGIPADSYDEFTEVNSRIYKDEFNEPDIIDGIKVDEIIEEVKDQAPSIKKAGGGIARMLGE